MDFRNHAGADISAEVFARAFESWPEAVAFLDVPAAPDQPARIRYVNCAFETLYRTQAQDAVGKSTLEFWRSRSATADQTLVEARMREGKPFKNTRVMEFPDSGAVWLEVSFSPVDGTGAGLWMFIARDVTTAHDINRRLSQLSSAVDKASDVIAIYVWAGGEWCIDYTNEAFTRTLGYDRESVLGRPSDHFVATDADIAALHTNRNLLRAGHTVRDALRMKHQNGTVVEMEFTGRPLYDAQTETFSSTVVVYRDVTEVLRRQRLLLHAVEHDALTGAYNRSYCEEHLKACIAETGRGTTDHAFLFIDLDGFKSVNDRLGHRAGDEALMMSADVFKSCVLGSDIVARWGGDEFGVVLHQCSLDNAQAVARRMIGDLASRADGLGIGASIGIIALRDVSAVAQALERADGACYEAKKHGGNRAVIAGSRSH